MNIKLLFALGAVAAMGVGVGCADRTCGPTGGPAEGGSDAGGSDEGGAPAMGCDAQHPEGRDLAATQVILECGCKAGAPCEGPCGSLPVCENPGPTSGDPDCAACNTAQADAQADCALTAALGEACQTDPECSAYINCRLAEG